MPAMKSREGKCSLSPTLLSKVFRRGQDYRSFSHRGQLISLHFHSLQASHCAWSAAEEGQTSWRENGKVEKRG